MSARLDERLAVCSWSLRAQSPVDLARKIGECGLGGVQLHLDPIREGGWDLGQTERAMRNAGIRIVSGMMAMKGEDYTTLGSIAVTGGVRPDATWEHNLSAARANAQIAARLGLSLVTFHAGFVPHDPRDPERRTIVDRTRAIAAAYRAKGIHVALETGQETAENLLTFLEEVNRDVPVEQRLGVNFDPANMILYGTGKPIDALRSLLPHVVQVHIKDARASTRAGEWGEETPAGQGQVDWGVFFAVLKAAERPVNFVIERESGEQRISDVRAGAELVRRLAGEVGA